MRAKGVDVASQQSCELSFPKEWLRILRCPKCKAKLKYLPSQLSCWRRHIFPVLNGVPILLKTIDTDGFNSIDFKDPEHKSHQASAEIMRHFHDVSAPWLHLGAGNTFPYLEGSIELETLIFRNTNIVGDCMNLPFADLSLGGLLALNVFEHLSDPVGAADEIYRCLRPGSPVVIQTAFLQPLHSDPNHFYNATEDGIRYWFSKFRIQDISVPGNFNPIYAFSWMSFELISNLEGEAVTFFGQLTLDQLAEFWRDNSGVEQEIHDAFKLVPENVIKRLAAGFQLVGFRP